MISLPNSTLPRISITPLSGLIRLRIHFIVVVFPAPFGHKNPKTSQSLISKFTSFNICFPSKYLSRLFIFSTNSFHII